MVQNHKDCYANYVQGRKLSKKFDALSSKMTDYMNDVRVNAGLTAWPPSPQASGAPSVTIPYDEWNNELVDWGGLEEVVSGFTDIKGKAPLVDEDDHEEVVEGEVEDRKSVV